MSQSHLPASRPGGDGARDVDHRAPSLVSLAAVGAAAGLMAIEAVSLVRRGAAGASDIGVFYRTCALLRDGVRAIYPRPDAVTGWPISMPPLGFAIFQPFSAFGPWGSSVAWAVFNLGLLALSTVLVRRVLERTGDARYVRAWPWAVVLLLILAAGSVQVGQFSVLFATCWLLFMDAFGSGRPMLAAIWLALPAAIKIYPVGLVAAPLSIFLVQSGRERAMFVRRSVQYVLWVALAIVVLWFPIPGIAYGRDTFGLNVLWWRGVILNNAQMDYLQSLRAITNQSLDTVLLRFLSYDPAFHDRFTSIPHLALAKATVLHLAHVARLAIVLVSVMAVWRGSGADLMMLMALWVATLYNVVPETKARYAVYTFIAFLPWLALVFDAARSRAQRVGAALVVVSAAACALVFLPDSAQAWGVGFLGPFVLWAGNAIFVARARAAQPAR